MKKYQWFGVLLLAFVTHQLLEKVLQIRIALLDNYLDAFLCMPLLLYILLWEQRVLFRKGSGFVFSKLYILLYFLLISFISEFLFPKWSSNFTSDFMDIVCIALGTMFFGIVLNKPDCCHQAGMV